MVDWNGMSFPDNLDAQTSSLMTRVLEDAWTDLRAMLVVEPLDADKLREKLALKIVTAVRDGERDLKQLKLIALGVI